MKSKKKEVDKKLQKVENRKLLALRNVTVFPNHIRVESETPGALVMVRTSTVVVGINLPVRKVENFAAKIIENDVITDIVTSRWGGGTLPPVGVF